MESWHRRETSEAMLRQKLRQMESNDARSQSDGL